MVFRCARMRATLGSGVAVLALSLTIGAAAAAASGPSQMTPVAQGVNPAALPGSKVFGNTPASTPETVSFVLRAQNLGQLESSVTGGLSHFLSVRQFASAFGQSPATIAALRNYLGSFGISTQAYANNLDVVATTRP